MNRRRLFAWALLLVLGVPAGRAAEPDKPADSPPAAPVPRGRLSLALDPGGHSGAVTKVFFTPDGKQLITLSTDQSIRLWDTTTWQTQKVIYPPPGDQLWYGALSPDGERLAVASGYWEKGKHVFIAYLFALPEGRLERVLRGHTAFIEGLAFTADGKHLATSGGLDRTTRIWDLAGDAPPRTFHDPWGYGPRGIAFSPDGKRLARVREGSGGSQWCQVIDAATGKEVVGNFEGGRVAWSPDGKTLAACIGPPNGGFQLYEPDGKVRTHVLKNVAVSSITFSQDSQSILAVWGRTEGALFDVATGKQRMATTPRGTGSGPGTALSPDGRLAVSTGWSEGGINDVFVWKTADGKLARDLTAPRWISRMPRAAWSPDGKAVCWQEWGDKVPAFDLVGLRWRPPVDRNATRGSVLEDGPVSLKQVSYNVWKILKKGKPPVEFGGNGQVKVTLVGPDRIAVCDYVKFALVDAGTGKEAHPFGGHIARVESIAPSPDGRYLMSVSQDQTLKVWDPEKNRPLLSLYVRGRDWVMWTEEGYYAASPGGERLMGWKVNNGINQVASFYPASQFRASLYRPDVIGRVLAEGSVAKALKAADAARGVMESKAVEVDEVLPPHVTLSAPGVKDGKVKAPTVEVEATAQGVARHPVTALQLLLDGRPYAGTHGLRRVEEARAGKEIKEKWRVELPPGEHTLRVLARTDASMGLSNDLEIHFAVPSPRPRLYVLAVGIDAYKAKGLKLKCAVHDATELRRTFEARSKELFEVEARVLTDADASREAILGGLKWLKGQMHPEDLAVIFYAGHGMRDDKGRFYLLPCDADAGRLAATGISAEALKEQLADLPGKVLLLLDACHSGAIGKAINDLAHDLADDDTGVVVMCAALGGEQAGEDMAVKHGYFCQALIEGLGGKAGKSPRDGCVYLHHLEHYVIDRVGELSKDEQHPTTAKPTIRSFAVAKP